MNFFDPWLIWFLVGLVLILTEFAIPGVILGFFGIGAWVASLLAGTGIVGSLGGQVLVFGVSSLAMLFTLRRFFKNWFVGRVRDETTGSENLDEYIGKTAVVVAPLPPGGRGKIEFKGAQWNATCSEALAIGERVTITALDGLTLTVAKS